MHDAARQILADAGRPMSARKLLQIGGEQGRFSDELTVDKLRAALLDMVGIVEVRRGVFQVGEAATPAQPPTEVQDEREARERRRRRRRPKAKEIMGEVPLAATSVEAAVAEAEGAEPRALGARLWAKMRDQVATVVGSAPAPRETPSTSPPAAAPAPAETPRRAAPASDAAEAAADAPEDPRAALKARLAARRRRRPAPAAPVAEQRPAPAPAPVAQQRPTPAPVADPPPEPAPAASPPRSRRPYREGRRGEQEITVERRRPALPEARTPAGLAADVRATLAGVGEPLSPAELADRVEASQAATRGAVLAENSRQRAAGLRPVFLLLPDGRVGLEEWSLGARYQVLEERVQAALAEQREIIRRDVLERVAELGDAGFEQVVVLLLELMGHEAPRIIHRQAGKVALVTRNEEERVAVVAHRAWTAIEESTVVALRDNLGAFDASRGMILTVGTFRGRALAAGRDARIRLVDGRGLARLLYEHSVGLSEHRPPVRYVDGAFFLGLG